MDRTFQIAVRSILQAAMSILVAATILNSTVTLSVFRVFVGLDDSICDLNQQRPQITSGAGDSSGLYRFAALVVTRTTACP